MLFKQGILKTDNDFLGVTFKGVDQSFDSTFIANNLVSGRNSSISLTRKHKGITYF